MHGNPYCLGNGKSDGWTISSTEITALDHCNVGFLLLSSCNAGHVSHATSNPANAFSGVISGTVYACDGTVYFRKKSFSRKSFYEAIDDDDFRQYLPEGSTRDPVGWVSYYGGKGIHSYEDSLKFIIK